MHWLNALLLGEYGLGLGWETIAVSLCLLETSGRKWCYIGKRKRSILLRWWLGISGTIGMILSRIGRIIHMSGY